MNYSKTIRNYCLDNKGMIFDVSYEMERHFNVVPYKTLLKILNRLEDEGILATISKGVYLIKPDGELDYDPIIKFYTDKYSGVLIGYVLYEKYGLLETSDDRIEILTNKMQTSTKNIAGKYTLIRYDSDSLLSDEIAILEALEIIEGTRTMSVNPVKKADTLAKLLTKYSDFVLASILKRRKYQYSTICTMEVILRDMKIENKATTIYLDVRKGD